MITDQNSTYFEFLKVREGKDVMDPEMYAKCSQIARDLEINEKVKQVIQTKSDENYLVYNELPLVCDLPSVPFGLKGVLDNVTVDHANKKVIINDIKTTGKTLHDFQETVKFYNYWIQAAVYKHLLSSFQPVRHFLDEGYSLSFNFIVIDKYLQIYPFRVSETTYNQWFMELNNVVLPRINWHYQTRQFNLPYEFATEDLYL
jgi:hypothetical protein